MGHLGPRENNMITNHRLKLLKDVLALPTAPFAEQHVIEFVRNFADARKNVSWRQDAVGNVMMHYRRGSRRVRRPVCLSAHLDHPGFVATNMISKERVRADWRGGVFAEYIPTGTKVRFFSDGAWVKGTVAATKTVKKGTRRIVKDAVFHVKQCVAADSPGMWDFPDPVVRDGRIHTRACDDLAGAAAMLACIDEIDRRRVTGEAYFLFTRAEEVGFIGAMAACRLNTVPKRCVVVAVENSSQLINAKMGDGPILRVGDRATTFTSSATAFCANVATDLAKRNKRFKWQRRLMDGGACESSAFCELGYDATGMCIALGNYHNMNTRTKKLGPEFVDLNDFSGLVDWFVALVTTKQNYTGRNERLKERLTQLQNDFDSLLKRTAANMLRRR